MKRNSTEDQMTKKKVRGPKSDPNENDESVEKYKSTTKFQITIGYNYQELDDELVIYDLLTDRGFRMNPTGKFIWEKLGKEIPLGEVADQLAVQFKVGKRKAFEVCEAFAREMHDKRLISKYSENH